MVLVEYRTIQLTLLPRPDQSYSQKYELAGTGFSEKAGARLTKARSSSRLHQSFLPKQFVYTIRPNRTRAMCVVGLNEG